MSSSIRINANVLDFIPTSSSGEKQRQLQSSDAVRRELRNELDAEYRRKLESELSARMAEAQSHFKRALQQYTTRFDDCVVALRKKIEDDVVDLSIRLAEIIVRHELPDREMLQNLIVNTLEPVSDLQGALVRISSADWALFSNQIVDGDHLGAGSTVQFAEDPNLSSGDIIVESRNGIFDARLDERLKLLKELLHERSGRTSTKCNGH